MQKISISNLVKLLVLSVLLLCIVISLNEIYLYVRANEKNARLAALNEFNDYYAFVWDIDRKTISPPQLACSNEDKKIYQYNFIDKKSGKTFSARVTYAPFDISIGEGPFENRCGKEY